MATMQVYTFGMAILVVTCSLETPVTVAMHTAQDTNCVSDGQTYKSGCSCEMTDGTGVIDISSVGYNNNQPRFKDYKAPDGAMYSYNPCHGFTEGNCSNSAVCQTMGNITLTIGQAEPVDVQWNPDLPALEMAYHSKHKQIAAAVVVLLCDQTACDPVFEPMGGDNLGVYVFKMTSVCACPGMCTSSGANSCKSSSGLQVGSIVCICIFSILTSYLICGMLYRKIAKKASGSDLIPHKKFWSRLPGRIRDGIVYTFCCSLHRQHRYQTTSSEVVN